MASDSPTTNARRLKIAFTKVITWAGWNGLKIDMSKVDYICFTHLYKRRIPPIPSITLPMSTNQEEMRMYEPQPHIRWLGLIFDSKLSFRQHVQHLASQGAAAAGCMQMLTNMKGGLSHQNMKCYTTHAYYRLYLVHHLYGGTARRARSKKIKSIQNRSLRMILPVFTTTPIHAMQIESGIPPLQI